MAGAVVNVVEALTSRHSLSEHQHNFVNKLKTWEMALTGILITSANRILPCLTTVKQNQAHDCLMDSPLRTKRYFMPQGCMRENAEWALLVQRRHHWVGHGARSR